MASASNAARLCALACRRTSQTSQLPRMRRTQQITVQSLTRRAFSSSPARLARRDQDSSGDWDEGHTNRLPDLKRMNQSFAESATTEDLQHLDELAKTNGHNSIEQFVENALEDDRSRAREGRYLATDLERIDIGPRPNRDSFWYDEEDPEGTTEDYDEFDEDDITEMAHAKLAEVKDMRQYSRLIVWEMPLLSKFAKPFEVPKEDEVFRWRYTTYMGEAHPGERKVVLQFAPDDLKLSAVQTNKLKKLAGTRYNPETELIKISCESYEHQAQNKAYLSNLVDDLVTAAKDATDTFEDIPLDTRHHRVVKKPRFPEAWRMTDKRRLELNEYRQLQMAQDVEKEKAGQLVIGQRVIEEHLQKKMLEEQEKAKLAELITVPVGRGSGKTRR